MANRTLFAPPRASAATPAQAVGPATAPAAPLPAATATNAAGGRAYELSDRAALAQHVLTGTFAATYYGTAEAQLAEVLRLCDAVQDGAFVAKLAVYARERGLMKDAPALLLAWLAAHDGARLTAAFPRVVDTGKMLCTFVRVLRSGVAGRRSFGSRPKRLIRAWFDARTDEAVFRASVGTAKPSLADVLRMVHPKPATPSRRALYGYLSGRNPAQAAVDAAALPELVRAVEAFKAAPSEAPLPDVPWLLLTSLPLAAAHWRSLAQRVGWQALRMNLNTFARHGVWQDPAVVAACAARLRDPESVRKARVFPYQLLAAYANASADVPRPLVEALHDAMEVALENVPKIEGRVVVCPDVSGSMSSPVTGHRPGATSAMRCVDVAALVAAALLRKNPDAHVLPFEGEVVEPARLALEPRDSVMTNAKKLAAVGGGSTNCAAPLAWLNVRGLTPDLVVFVSDNESWYDPAQGSRARWLPAGPTSMVEEWAKLAARNPRARLACIDVQPNRTAQAPSSERVLNVGGFGDEVFDLLASFAGGELEPDHMLARVEAVEL